MAIKNITIAGDYQGVIYYKNKKKGLYINYRKFLVSKQVYINKDTVQSFEALDENMQTSAASGIIRGAVGGAVFGGIGAIAGAASGKKKGVHTVSIVFKDGTKCLCDLDDAMYKNLIIVMY